MTRRFIFLWCLVAGVLSGCGWNSMENWDAQGIWSDEGTSALGVYRFYEGKDTVTHTKIRNMETAIYFYPGVGDGSEPRLILPRAPGWARPMYLSSRRGYAIIHRQEKRPELDEGMNRTANFTAYKVDLNGGVTPLGQRQYLSMISCDAEGQSAVTTGDVLTVIPSPDGALLAKLEMTPTCDGVEGQLTFLDSETLSVLDDPIQLPPRADVNMLQERSWSEDGRFLIAQNSFMGLRGVAYAPGQPPADASDLDHSCYFPETASYSVNARGEYLSNRDGTMVAEPASPGFQAFGCE